MARRPYRFNKSDGGGSGTRIPTYAVLGAMLVVALGVWMAFPPPQSEPEPQGSSDLSPLAQDPFPAAFEALLANEEVRERMGATPEPTSFGPCTDFDTTMGAVRRCLVELRGEPESGYMIVLFRTDPIKPAPELVLLRLSPESLPVGLNSVVVLYEGEDRTLLRHLQARGLIFP